MGCSQKGASEMAHGFRVKQGSVMWRCSCGFYHTGNPHGSEKHTPIVNLEEWLPIGSLAKVTCRSAWAYGCTFKVLGHVPEHWDVILDCDHDGIGRSCSIMNCLPSRRNGG